MNKYDDIINLPHHVSKEHPQMSMYMRAAQFAPFAALTGHGSAIKETARKQQEQVELRSGYDEETDEFQAVCTYTLLDKNQVNKEK